MRTRVPAAAATGILTVLAVVAGGLVLSATSDSTDAPRRVAVGAPTVSVGDADAVVLATTFDGDGARVPITEATLDAIRAVPGVAAAEGVRRRFVEIVPAGAGDVAVTDSDTRSDRSTIALSAQPGSPLVFHAGRAPERPGEVAVNGVLAARYSLDVGTDVSVHTGSAGQSCTSSASGGTVCGSVGASNAETVVGIFSLPGGDVSDMNLAVFDGDELATLTKSPGYDRIDVKAADGVDVDVLLDRLSAAASTGYMAVPPSVIGSADQLRSELELQRMYHWTLDPDPAVRARNSVTPPTPESLQAYDKYHSQAINTELRVGRVSFVDADTALVTYRVYYDLTPSGANQSALTAVALRIDGAWRVSDQNKCQLGRLVGSQCTIDPSQEPEAYALPPDGWSAPDAVAGAADAFRVLADPTATLEQRVGAVEDGDANRTAVKDGLTADAPRAATGVELRIVGTRTLDATHAQVLYSLVATGAPRLETPYPLVGNAVLVDGTWRAARRYACGLRALAGLGCDVVTAPSTTVPSTTAPSTTTSAPPTSTTKPTVSTGPTTSVPQPVTTLPPTTT